MQKKKGISLIVLVITIIVMIILAAAIILSLNNAGIIGNANKAVEMTNDKTIQTAADLKYAEYILKNDIIGSSTVGEWIKSELIKDGIIPKGQEDNYNITDAGKVINNREYSTIQKEARVLYEKMVADGTVSTMLNQGEYIKQQLISNQKINTSQAENYRFKNNGDVVKLQTKEEYEAMYASELAMLKESYYTLTNGVFKMTTEGENAAKNGALTVLAIPYGTTKIMTLTGRDCISLTKLIMPDTLTTIEYSFSGANNIETIVLSKNITSIDWLFWNTKWMTNKKEEVKDGNGMVIEEGILFDITNAKNNVIIPNNVEIIRAWAAENAMGERTIESIVFPNTISSIGDYAFANMTTLTSVEFKGQIPEIGFGSFALTNLPESVKQQLLEKNPDAFNDEL